MKQFNNDSNVFLNIVANYNKTIDTNSHMDIITSFNHIFLMCARQMIDHFHIKQPRQYIVSFQRGIDTLIHVFTYIFFYTKNISLALHHTNKACMNYIEFVEQISDDSVAFLHLSPKEATTFVYKKTLYQINHECKKHMDELLPSEILFFHCFNKYTTWSKHLLMNLVQFHHKNMDDCWSRFSQLYNQYVDTVTTATTATTATTYSLDVLLFTVSLFTNHGSSIINNMTVFTSMVRQIEKIGIINVDIQELRLLLDTM